MNQSILDRYARTEQNVIIIDVAAEKIEDLYNNFDRNAPYIIKDLDESLTDYLVDAVSEIGKEDFVIRFRFATPAAPDVITRVRESIGNYFRYMKILEKRKLGARIRTSSIYFFAGLVLLAASILFNRQTVGMDSVVLNVFSQGLTIAAWVSLWEALANFLIHWKPHRRLMQIHQKIALAPLLFD